MADDVFKIIYLVGFVVGCLIRVPAARRRRRATITDRRKTGALEMALMIVWGVGASVIPVIYVVTPWLNFADYRLPVWAGVVGAVTFAAALWLLWRSHADLGANWSAEIEIGTEHSLVTHGVYRLIRHPMYAAHWLWGIGQALLLGNFIAGLITPVVFIPLYFMRAPREEQMMLDHFGDDYRSYMTRTGGVIPRLRR